MPSIFYLHSYIVSIKNKKMKKGLWGKDDKKKSTGVDNFLRIKIDFNTLMMLKN